jgi:hypothetical protein
MSSAAAEALTVVVKTVRGDETTEILDSNDRPVDEGEKPPTQTKPSRKKEHEIERRERIGVMVNLSLISQQTTS